VRSGRGGERWRFGGRWGEGCGLGGAGGGGAGGGGGGGAGGGGGGGAEVVAFLVIGEMGHESYLQRYMNAVKRCLLPLGCRVEGGELRRVSQGLVQNIPRAIVILSLWLRDALNEASRIGKGLEVAKGTILRLMVLGSEREEGSLRKLEELIQSNGWFSVGVIKPRRNMYRKNRREILFPN